MNAFDLPHKQDQDADLEGAMQALMRAAKQAKKIAKDTHTSIVIRREGKLVHETFETKSSNNDEI